MLNAEISLKLGSVGFAAVLAALVVLGAVNCKTYAAINEECQTPASPVQATPLIREISPAGLLATKKSAYVRYA
jgi:hypothetical protein